MNRPCHAAFFSLFRSCSYPIVSSSPSEHTRWFSEEVQPHERPLRSYLTRSLPSLADVDDLVQDCYVRILRARSTGPVHSAKGLLFAIARNAVRDFFRRTTKAVTIEITENDCLPVLDDEQGVVESVCRLQELALLEDAINALPERCREVLLLRKIKGISQREIADLLGISENTVESLVVKGARRCAEYLRALGVGPRDHHARRT